MYAGVPAEDPVFVMRVPVGSLSEPEVGDLHLAVGTTDQIRRLDVAMDDSFLVRRLQSRAGLHRNVERFFERQWARGDFVLHAHAVDEFHCQEPVLLVDLEDGADVGMVQRRGGLRLAQKALAVLQGMGRKKLQRDCTPQLRVFSLVDDTHPALAELLEDAVVRDGLADHRRSR
jgi:hypothetical protein